MSWSAGLLIPTATTTACESVHTLLILCQVCVCVCHCRCLSDYEVVAREAYNQHISNPEVGMLTPWTLLV